MFHSIKSSLPETAADEEKTSNRLFKSETTVCSTDQLKEEKTEVSRLKEEKKTRLKKMNVAKLHL